MARRTIEMIELEEVLYQWIKGIGIKGISRSLGISRNTVKKIILQAQQAGLSRQSTVKELEGLRGLLKNPSRVSIKAAPAQHYLSGQHEQIEAWHQMPHMTVTQMVGFSRIFSPNWQ